MMRTNQVVDAAIVRWTSWPIVDAGWVGALLPVTALSAGMATASIAADDRWGFLMVALLFALMWKWLVPSEYELTPQGISIRTFLHRRDYSWRMFAGFILYPGGCILSVGKSGGKLLDLMQGVSLRFGKNRHEAMAVLRRHLGGPL